MLLTLPTVYPDITNCMITVIIKKLTEYLLQYNNFYVKNNNLLVAVITQDYILKSIRFRLIINWTLLKDFYLYNLLYCIKIKNMRV